MNEQVFEMHIGVEDFPSRKMNVKAQIDNVDVDTAVSIMSCVFKVMSKIYNVSADVLTARACAMLSFQNQEVFTDE